MRTEVVLREWEWNAIRGEFDVPAGDAAAERGQIAAAIARFETIVGRYAGTSNDLPENRLSGVQREGQMDCIDESTNATTYLQILSAARLLRWHRVEEPRMRGSILLVFGWPHWSAVVSERQGGRRWAVDSWFFANGEPPVIVPIETWFAGWRPEAAPQIVDARD